MSELKDRIVSDMTAAMKAREKEKVAALRMLKAAIMTEEVSGEKHELTDEQVLAVVAREIKKRRESAEVYAENGRQELAAKELSEVEFFTEYQPAQLSDAELDDLVESTIAEVVGDGERTMKQMGPVMGAAKKKAGAQVEGGRLSAAVKKALGA